MLQSDLSMYISKKFLNYGLLQDDDVDVMAYYLENMISLSLVILSIIGIAIVTGLCKESALYFLTFFIGRYCCGGYHAKTHLRCYMLTMGTYLLFLLLTVAFENAGEPCIAISFIIVAANILMLLFAPADSENKRFTKKERELYRKKSLFLLLVCDLLYVGVLTNLFTNSFFPFFFAVFQLAVSVAMVKMLERKNGVKD